MRLLSLALLTCVACGTTRPIVQTIDKDMLLVTLSNPDKKLWELSEAVLTQGKRYFSLHDSHTTSSGGRTTAVSQHYPTTNQTVIHAKSSGPSTTSQVVVRVYDHKPQDTFSYDAATILPKTRYPYVIRNTWKALAKKETAKLSNKPITNAFYMSEEDEIMVYPQQFRFKCNGHFALLKTPETCTKAN